MTNRTKEDLRTKLYLLTTLLIMTGIAVPAVLSMPVIAVPYGNKWQDHKGWSFGPIASIQNDKNGKPAWILSGHWVTNVINKTKESFNQTNPAKFDAWINMVMLNGSAMHKHTISNFSLTNATMQDKISTYKGTITITMKEGPVKDVPVEIKVMDNHAVATSVDGAKTNNHFGNTPIFGTIVSKQEISGMMSMMSKKGNMSMMGMGKGHSTGQW